MRSYGYGHVTLAAVWSRLIINQFVTHALTIGRQIKWVGWLYYPPKKFSSALIFLVDFPKWLPCTSALVLSASFGEQIS